MKRTQAGLLVAGLLVVPAIGCNFEPDPSADAILYYLRSARVHGKVRRCWPAGQQYVDAVLKADAALMREYGQLAEWLSPESLWHTDDPQWRSRDALRERADVLREVIEGHRPLREQYLRDLSEAVGNVPPDLGFDSAARQQFVDAVWDALKILGRDWHESLADAEAAARMHLDLIEAVMACAGSFDPQGQGLAFTDSACQKRVADLYSRLRTTLDAFRGNLLDYAEAVLAETDRALENLDKRRQRNLYDFLTDRRRYLRDLVRQQPKAIFSLMQKKQEELKALRKRLKEGAASDRAVLEARAAFLERYVAWLGERRAALKERTDAILAADEAAAARTDTAG